MATTGLRIPRQMKVTVEYENGFVATLDRVTEFSWHVHVTPDAIPQVELKVYAVANLEELIPAGNKELLSSGRAFDLQ